MRYLVLSVLTSGFTLVCTAQTETKSPVPNPPPGGEKGSGPEVDSPTAKGDRLRRPGFLFLELDCHDIADSIDFFREVAGYEINRNDGDFVILRSERGELLLNRRPPPKTGASGAKPITTVQGPRIEIGIVVGDLDKSFAAAKKHAGWTIASGIARQPWGVRDFRVFSPERYYLRVTEGPK